MTGYLEPTSRLRAAPPHHQVAKKALKRQEHLTVPPPILYLSLQRGDHPLVKADTFKGKRKIRDRWEEETCEVVHQIATDIPSYKVTDQCRWSCILH